MFVNSLHIEQHIGSVSGLMPHMRTLRPLSQTSVAMLVTPLWMAKLREVCADIALDVKFEGLSLFLN